MFHGKIRINFLVNDIRNSWNWAWADFDRDNLQKLLDNKLADWIHELENTHAWDTVITGYSISIINRAKG